MTQQKQYVVPRKVTTRLEFAPGFGIAELCSVLIGAAVGYLAYRLASALHAPPPLRVGAGVLPPVAAFFLVHGEENSLANRLRLSRRFQQMPQRYLYQAGTSAEVGLPRGNEKGLWTAAKELLGIGPKEQPVAPSAPLTVQRWLPVRDVENGMIIRRDGALVAALEIQPINLGLMSPSEQMQVIGAVHEVVNSLQQPAQILSIPRPLDLDAYIHQLEAQLSQVSPDRQRMLRQYIRYVAGQVEGGQAQERRYYILLSQEAGRGARADLLQLVNDLVARLNAAGLRTHELGDAELFNLLYVWSHPNQAAFERSPVDGPALISRLEV